MTRLPNKVRLLAVAVVCLALFGCGVAVALHPPGPLTGWYQRAFRTPPILSASFIVPFDKQRGQSQREQFISVYQARHGSYGLRRTAFSVEGTPIGECLLVEAGALTLITDYTRDSYGIREFRIQHPGSVALGKLLDGERWGFVTASDSHYLKSYADSKLIHCF